jgi:hypothetical protein
MKPTKCPRCALPLRKGKGGLICPKNHWIPVYPCPSCGGEAWVDWGKSALVCECGLEAPRFETDGTWGYYEEVAPHVVRGVTPGGRGGTFYNPTWDEIFLLRPFTEEEKRNLPLRVRLAYYPELVEEREVEEYASSLKAGELLLLYMCRLPKRFRPFVSPILASRVGEMEVHELWEIKRKLPELKEAAEREIERRAEEVREKILTLLARLPRREFRVRRETEPGMWDDHSTYLVIKVQGASSEEEEALLRRVITLLASFLYIKGKGDEFEAIIEFGRLRKDGIVLISPVREEEGKRWVEVELALLGERSPGSR